MKNKITLLIAALGFTFGLSAQVNLGTVSGYIYQANDSTSTIELTRVWIETETGDRGTRSDLDGKYKIDALRPGVYNLYAKATNFDTTVVAGVVVSPDGITTVDVYCTDDNVLGIVVIDFNRVKIEKDIHKVKITTEDIENSPYIRDPKGLLAGTSSDIQQVEGTNDIIIRGSRPGDAVYFIDGVKSTDMSAIPGVAISGIEAYTGGIPAKYGDTTGGVVVLETKSYFDLYYAWKARQ